MKLAMVWVAVIGMMAGVAGAAHDEGHAAPGHGRGHPAGPDNAAHPKMPEHPTWTGKVVGGIVTLFVSAVAIGLLVRANMPEEIPVAHSHDEPPGTSGHHGHGGEVQAAPTGESEKHGHAHSGHH